MPVKNVWQMRKDAGFGKIPAGANANLVFECTNLSETLGGKLPPRITDYAFRLRLTSGVHFISWHVWWIESAIQQKFLA